MALSAKLLAPLATVAVAGAVAVGSGATFTSQTVDTVAVTAGTLKLTSSGSANLTLENMKPGETRSGTFTIKNEGSLPAKLTVSKSDVTNTFATNGVLSVKVKDASGTVVHQGSFDQLLSTPIASGDLDAGASRSYTFDVTLGQNASNADQGKTASAKITWAAVPR